MADNDTYEREGPYRDYWDMGALIGLDHSETASAEADTKPVDGRPGNSLFTLCCDKRVHM